MDHSDLSGTPSSAEIEAARASISRGTEALRVVPPKRILDQLLELAILLSNWAPRMNLTAHRGPEAIAQRLILDAIALFQVLPSFEKLTDLGSGAGFPYLPIAILHPEREFLSVEARSRRVSFQRTVVRTLGLQNIQIENSRIEDLEPSPGDAAVAQALAEPSQARDYLSPWVRPGGWIAIPGTPESMGSPPANPPGFSGAEVRTYRVPELELERRVWFAQRDSDATESA